ncbi:MAG: T9SS type A sorting domain-containing protein [Flavobacteriales bacterium]|nr:T9SS type A sorting domain-containing protein [Flavobacteriales bacterium]
MKKQALYLMTLVWSCCAEAQPTFTKYYYATGTAKLNLNEISSGNIVTGMARQSGTSVMDPAGNIVHTHCYAIDTFLVLQSVKQYNDNEFFFVGGYYKDTCTAGNFGVITQIHPAIGRMDSLGSVLNLKHYVLNAGCTNACGDLSITSNKCVLAWGRDAMFFALKTDSIGETIWAKRFSNVGGFQFIKELPSGDLLAGINMDTAAAVVARLDPAGNFIWCKSYIRPRGMVHDCLIESDSSFIITGYTDSIASTNGFTPLPLDYHPRLFTMKLDGSGDVQWCKGYDSDPHLWYARRGSRIVRAQDGNYVVLANFGIEGFNRPFRPFLMKTDLNGDTIWTRSAGVNGYTYDTRDLLAYSDGGFMYNGVGTGIGTYLFKTDSLGHLPCNEEWYPVQVTDLFPTDSSFTLTSVDGATALPAFIGDTIYDPVVTLDGCTITSVIDPRNPRKFKIYPNPNSGRFTVEFEDPLMAESYYSVYDAMGRLLYQRPLPTGATMEQVDLSRYGKGAYVIKLTDREGVRYERVVLE